MGLLIDTTVIIEHERQSRSAATLLERWGDESITLAAITASEILHGVHRAESGRRRDVRRRFVETLLTGIPILPFTLDIARVHAHLWADLTERGEIIGTHDIMIAATALVHSHTIVTKNLRHFQRVRNLQVEQC